MNMDQLELIQDGLADHPDTTRDAAIWNDAYDSAIESGASQAVACDRASLTLNRAYDAAGWSV